MPQFGQSAPPRNPRLTAIPAARSSAPVLQIRLYLVLGALALSSLAGVGAMVAWASQPPAADTSQNVVPRGRALASLVAGAYLRGDVTPVPVVADLTYNPPKPGVFNVVGNVEWDGFTRETTTVGATFERHAFLFHRALPGPDNTQTVGLYRLIVELAVPGDGEAGNPALAAAPTVLPAVLRNSGVVADYSDDKLVGDLPPQARQVLTEQWVKAFAVNNTDLLLQYSGDKETGYLYAGLGGFSEASTLEVQTAVSTGADAWLVRVRVRLVGANELTAEMDLDVTIQDASTATPKIVAWGPAGSGVLGPDAVRVPADQ